MPDLASIILNGVADIQSITATGVVAVAGPPGQDGSGGDMYLAGTETVTGAKTFNAGTLLDKGNQVFNVKAYGAVGDGSTSDYAAINTTIATAGAAGGGIVYLPTSSYKANGAIIMNQDNVTLMGSGWGSKLVSGAAILITGNNCKIVDLAYSGVGSIAVGCDSLGTLTGVDGFEMYGCDILATQSWALMLEAETADPASNHSKNIKIHHNRIRKTTSTTVETTIVSNYVENVDFHDNYVKNDSGGGFNAYGVGMKNIRVHNNYFELGGPGSMTATTVMGSDCSVTGNHYSLDGPGGIAMTSDISEGGPTIAATANNMVISGNVLHCTSGTPIAIDKGRIEGIGETKNILIQGNAIFGGNSQITICADNVLIQGNILDGLNNASACIQMGLYADMQSIEISGNIIRNAGSSGGAFPAIETYTESGHTSNITGLRILNNTIYDESVTPTMNYGIKVNSTNGKTVTDVHINGNTIYNVANQGILFYQTANGSISGNTIRDCAVTSGTAGVYLGHATYVDVQNNRIYDTGSPKTQTYGIQEAESSDNNLISNNDLRGNLTSGLAIVGASTIAMWNAGSEVDKANYSATGGIASLGLGGIGYATGAGGTVTQATDKSTGVTLSKVSGAITLNNAALAADTTVSFVLTNTAIAATDVLILNHISGGTVGAYTLNAQAAAGSATINVHNVTAGSLGEAVVIQFCLIKGVNS